MEKSSVWMEESLRRTSALGRAVLERARCREVDCWSACIHDGRSLWTHPAAGTPEEEHLSNLEEAFSTLSRFMQETTAQCERYHGRIPAQEMNTSELQHFSRFHRRKLQPIPGKTPPTRAWPLPPVVERGTLEMFQLQSPLEHTVSLPHPPMARSRLTW